MNDNIAKLLRQSTEVRYTGLLEVDIVNYEKFAELIVQECADLAYAGEEYNPMDDYDRGWQRGRNVAAKKIKEHFGVER